MDAEDLKWFSVFMPRALREMQRVRDNGIRFVHYCTAESGLAILQSQRMFLRNSMLMNDFSEVDYGANCLSMAYNGPIGERLKTVLRAVQDDLPEVVEAHHNELLNDIKHETYLIAISEHGGDNEDRLGRLSMWRAYGARNGVAFVFNNTPFLSESDALKAYSMPVAYSTPEQFAESFEEMVTALESELETLKASGGPFLYEWLMLVFRFAVQATKHPAFLEEREWRVIYSPTLLIRYEQMTEQQLGRVPTEIRCIGGVPQRVYAIPFRNYVEDGLTGATVPELIEKVLIGPSADSYAIAQAFVAELEIAGVENPASKVWITGIPLRG